MPYIPKQDRSILDKRVHALADGLSERLKNEHKTAEMSVLYRDTFNELSSMIGAVEAGERKRGRTTAEKLATAIVNVAKKYNYQGAWLGELNYAVTRLIQATPLMMVEKSAWKEPLRYWIYAETAGALIGAARDMGRENAWIGNGLSGVFEDIKDEYKRRVNTAYEAAQIIKSGDCYELSPYRTAVIAYHYAGAVSAIQGFDGSSIDGFQEVMLPKAELSDLLVALARMQKN